MFVTGISSASSPSRLRELYQERERLCDAANSNTRITGGAGTFSCRFRRQLHHRLSTNIATIDQTTETAGQPNDVFLSAAGNTVIAAFGAYR